MEVLNVFVLEFGWSAGWLTLSALLFMGVALLWDGVRGVPGCMERRAARRKEHFVHNMKLVLREMGTGKKE
jgi:hypothetical protein